MAENLSDVIELYLKGLIESMGNSAEFSRKELSLRFRCAPSQINYVLCTRFGLKQGYIVETKRGGGGFVKIFRTSLNDDFKAGALEKMSFDDLNSYMTRLSEAGALDEFDLKLVSNIVNSSIAEKNILKSDDIKTHTLRSLLTYILHKRSDLS